MSADNSVFARNKRALELFDPRTAACLAHHANQSTAGFHSAPNDSSAPALPPRGENTVVLFGLGDGSKLLELLKRPSISVVVVECEVKDCLALLHGYDFSEALASDRLHLFMAQTASPISREISLREGVSELLELLHQPGRNTYFAAPPTTEPPDHSDFYTALSQGVEDAERTMTEFAAALAPDAAFDVTVVSPCCVIFDDLARCFHRLGLKVQLLRVPDQPGIWTETQLRSAQLSLVRAPSRLLVTRNRTLLEPERATDYPQPEALIPGERAMWWWDVPNVATYINLRYPHGDARAFGFARDILPLLPQGAEWLPPGARMSFVDAGMQPEPEQDIDLSFVGQSRLENLYVNLKHLKHVLGELGAKAPALGKDLERNHGYVQLYNYVSRHREEILGTIASRSAAFPAHAYFLRYLFEMVMTGVFRIAAIEYLLKHGIDVALYGDDDWLKVPGVTAKHFKGICAPESLPLLYRRSRINLNLNFMQVSSTINPKVLDIAAAGAVALTDYRPELELLYPDPAARPFAFRTLEQMAEKIAVLGKFDLTHHRHAVRAHTCAHHTLQHRAEWLARHFNLLSEKRHSEIAPPAPKRVANG
jgi:hypothetical protein